MKLLIAKIFFSKSHDSPKPMPDSGCTGTKTYNNTFPAPYRHPFHENFDFEKISP